MKFLNKIDKEKLRSFIGELYNDVFLNQVGILSDYDYENLDQDDDDFKNFLFKKETGLSQLGQVDCHTQLQKCVFPNDVVEPFNYKKAFEVALERFLKDLE